MRNNLFKIESNSAYEPFFVLYVDRWEIREFERSNDMRKYTVTQQ